MTKHFGEDVSIFKQIALHIENSILEGSLAKGDALPSLRENAVTMEVNINTIMRAYSLLEAEGIIIKKRGLGFFVSEHALKDIQAKRRAIFYKQTIPELLQTLEFLDISMSDLQKALEKEKNLDMDLTL